MIAAAKVSLSFSAGNFRCALCTFLYGDGPASVSPWLPSASPRGER
jgi:hypothetical protein